MRSDPEILDKVPTNLMKLIPSIHRPEVLKKALLVNMNEPTIPTMQQNDM